MEQSSSWEANRFSASQKIPRILWNPKVYYRTYTCPPPVPILSQLDTVYTPTTYFITIHFNITLSSTPGSSKWSLFFRFSYQNSVYTSSLHHTRYMTAKLIILDFITRKMMGEDYRSLSSSLCIHFPVTLSLLGPNILQHIQNACYRKYYQRPASNRSSFKTILHTSITLSSCNLFYLHLHNVMLYVMFLYVLCFCILYFH
jgi:hypothetical protein